MFVSDRSIVIPDLGAALTTRAFVHLAHRVHLVQNTGIVSEDNVARRAFTRKGAVGRPVLTVVLQGRARIRADEDRPCWLESGGVAVMPSKAALSVRQDGATYAALVVEWDVGTLGPRPAPDAGRLSVRALGRVGALVADLRASGEGREVPDVVRAERLAALFDALRAEGLPLRAVDARELVEPVDPETLKLAALLDRLLNRLEERPMAVDFERALGVGFRDVTGLVAGFNARYGFNSGDWRDTVLRRRLLGGMVMMTARGARTERVSAALGYSSPTAFCRAMADAGFPSPGAMAGVVASLR